MAEIIIVTGPVGVGKTSTAYAISEILNETREPHAVVDIDALRMCYPRPSDDPFYTTMGFRNLAVVCANYRAAGTERFILVDVVEDYSELKRYEKAIPGAKIQVVRLLASLSTIHQRLEKRESADNLPWYQNRAVELIDLMDERGIGDILIETDGKTVYEVGREILSLCGWDEDKGKQG